MEGGIEVDLRLSSKGLTHIPLEIHEGDFEFIVGDEVYKCNSIIAEFLSPKISRLRRFDPSFSAYKLETDDLSFKFNEFISLAFDADLHIDAE